MQFYQSVNLQYLWFIPIVIGLLYFASQRKKKILAALGNLHTIQSLMASHSPTKLRWKNILIVLSLILLIVSLAQPQWGEEKKKIKRKGIDLIFLVDASLSMLSEDVKPNRLEKARFEMRSFLRHLKGDRIGIVTFAGSGFLQSPLTLDYSAFSLFADSIDVGYIPDMGTNLSEGIQTAVKSLPAESDKYRAVVILSDGENMEEDIENAIESAKKAGVRLYTIGIGTVAGEPIPLKSSDGKTSGYKKDKSGEIVISKLNESLLKKIATETGGLYFQATPGETETGLVYEHIQSLGKKEFKEQVLVEREDHFQVFLLFGIILLLVETIIGDRLKRHAKTV